MDDLVWGYFLKLASKYWVIGKVDTFLERKTQKKIRHGISDNPIKCTN